MATASGSLAAGHARAALEEPGTAAEGSAGDKLGFAEAAVELWAAVRASATSIALLPTSPHCPLWHAMNVLLSPPTVQTDPVHPLLAAASSSR